MALSNRKTLNMESVEALTGTEVFETFQENVDGKWQNKRVTTDVLAAYIGSGSGTGVDGKSAYQLAVQEGFTGTLQEWLTSLEGADGETPEFRIEAGFLETRTGTDPWTQLLDLSTLTPDNTVVSSDASITDIVTLTQAEYDALGAPVATTYYVISDDSKGPPRAVITDPAYAASAATIDRSRGNVQVLTLTSPSTIDFTLQEGDVITLHLKGADVNAPTFQTTSWIGAVPTYTAHDVFEVSSVEGVTYARHLGAVTV